MLEDTSVPVVIVGYKNADDVAVCLAALAKLATPPSVRVLICENGGAKAFDDLVGALSAEEGPCRGVYELVPPAASFLRVAKLTLAGSGAAVHVGEAHENLGFGGGVNSWLKPLVSEQGWPGVWILNPDTWPEPEALVELVKAAKERHVGMLGSRLAFPDRTDIAGSRGLRWRRFLGASAGVDIFAPVEPEPDPADVEARIEAPIGASIYATRDCIERVGLMEDFYFLYMEDFDWGIRAKKICGIGYAHRSIVPHVGGSSTGAARSRAARSRLSVYLQYRNAILFVRDHYPKWYWWTAFIRVLWTAEFLVYRSVPNFFAAWRGLAAGLRGEVGRPTNV